MTIRHLKTFVKVCELESISKTAEELNIAQPSVSQTIKELENYYSMTLFNRANRKLTLTKDGMILLAKAREVIASFDEFEDAANKVESSPILHIGASLAFGTIYLPGLYKILRANFPTVDPYFCIDKIFDLQEKIISGELDFAFVEALRTDKAIESTLIGKDRLIAVVSPNYDIKDTITAKELLENDLLLRDAISPTRKILDSALILKGLKVLKPRMESVSNAAIIKMCLSSSGIAILPSHLVEPYIERKELKEIHISDLNLERKLYLIHSRHKKFTILGKKVYNLCVKLSKEKALG